MKFINKITSIVLCITTCVILFTGCSKKDDLILSYDFSNLTSDISDSYNSDLSKGLNYLSSNLCVAGTKDILSDNVNMNLAEAAGLFDIDNGKVLYAKNLHEKLYPASTTKILTALIALKYGNLDDKVTISKNCLDLESGASVCRFEVGDTPTLEQVLNGFLLCSGNDAGVAIAEHISGSVDEFAELMNKTAQELGATNSNFVNPHGLHNENHYTTVYDLYLIFNEAIKNDTFKQIIGKKSYTASFSGAGGITRELTWNTTNRYFKGIAATPNNITILGSKTGTTNEAGACLVLLSKNTANSNPYISIILKSSDAATMYVEMNNLLDLAE